MEKSERFVIHSCIAYVVELIAKVGDADQIGGYPKRGGIEENKGFKFRAMIFC